MSTVYDDISARLDAEQASIEGQAGSAKRDHDLALADADAERDAAVQTADSAFETAMTSLRARAHEVETIRSFMANSVSAPAAADPQQPSATGDATTSAPDEQPAPASEQPAPATPPDAPSTPTPEPEPTPSIESGDASSAPLPTASPDDALLAARGVDESQPIAVPLSTGQIAVVTAGDVRAAGDPEVEDAALTTAALNLRQNSDWP